MERGGAGLSWEDRGWAREDGGPDRSSILTVGCGAVRQMSNVCGALYVDSKVLRNELIPITQNTLDQIKGMLLVMAREACLGSLDELQGYCKALNERPEDLDEFMAYQVFHSQQAQDKIDIIKKAQVVDDMYELLTIYDQKVSLRSLSRPGPFHRPMPPCLVTTSTLIPLCVLAASGGKHRVYARRGALAPDTFFLLVLPARFRRQIR